MKKILLLTSLAAFTLSCEKALMNDSPADNPRENFNSLWETVRDKYSFFNIKNIDWDSIYTVYDPQVTHDMSEQQLFDVLDSMLYDLRDGHVNLVSPFDVSRNWEWYLDYPDNFNYEVVERYYLGDDYRIAGGIKYTIIDSVGYIYYGSFSSGFSHQNLDAVINYFNGQTKGVIIDVRNNGGGSLNNAFALAQRFSVDGRQVLLTFEKTGPGPDDFDNGLSYTLDPGSRIVYNGPVAVLTNRRCYSATNTFAGMMRAFDHVTLIGDNTGGGGGIPVDSELPNGWNYRFSATVSLIPVYDTAYYNIELGVPPDVYESTQPGQLQNGIDDIIEAGLAILE